MPSKTSFALLALLAASVSALPTRGYNDLYARGPTDTPAAAAVSDPNTGGSAAGPPPAVAVNAVTSPGPVAAGSGTGTHPHQHQHQHNQHPHQHNQHNQHPGSGLSHHHNNNGVSGTHRPHRHTHSGSLSQMSSQGTVHHSGPHHQRRLSHDVSSTTVNPPTPLTPSTASGAGAVVPPTGQQTTTISRREFYENPELERRGLLETLGLKARVESLSVKQTEQMTKAKTICGGLASKKDQHTCHKTVDKIIQLTKERNYVIQEFAKVSNHRDVFANSESSKSSSSSSTSSS